MFIIFLISCYVWPASRMNCLHFIIHTMILVLSYKMLYVCKSIFLPPYLWCYFHNNFMIACDIQCWTRSSVQCYRPDSHQCKQRPWSLHDLWTFCCDVFFEFTWLKVLTPTTVSKTMIYQPLTAFLYLSCVAWIYSAHSMSVTSLSYLLIIIWCLQST